MDYSVVWLENEDCQTRVEFLPECWALPELHGASFLIQWTGPGHAARAELRVPVTFKRQEMRAAEAGVAG